MQRSTFGRKQCCAMGWREARAWLANLWLWGPPTLTTLGRGWGGRPAVLLFSSDSAAVPTFLWGRQGADCKSSSRSKSPQRPRHDADWHWPLHSVYSAVPVANPIPSAGFPVPSHYRCSNLTKSTFILLQWGFFYLYGAQCSPLGTVWVCSHFIKPAPK